MAAPSYVGGRSTDIKDSVFSEVAWAVRHPGVVARSSAAQSIDDVNHAIDAELDKWIAACGGDARVALYEAMVMAAIGFEQSTTGES